MGWPILSPLAFALAVTLAVMSASWGLQRLRFFRQATSFNRMLLVAVTIFAITFVLQLLWP